MMPAAVFGRHWLSTDASILTEWKRKGNRHEQGGRCKPLHNFVEKGCYYGGVTLGDGV